LREKEKVLTKRKLTRSLEGRGKNGKDRNIITGNYSATRKGGREETKTF